MTNKIKRRLEKMNFLTQERKIEPMTQNDKYLLKAIQKQKSIEKQNENISRFERGSLRS
jgi:hypothetical protein